jgi:uncharacterized protein
MTVLRADSFEAAHAMASEDPFCKVGAVSFQIQKWQVNEGRIQIHVDISDQTYHLE